MPTRMRSPLALLVFAAACASAPPPPPAAPPPPPPPPLPAPDYIGEPAIEALAVLLRMEDRRSFDRAAIEPLLADSSALVRSRAVLAAGRLRDAAATQLLVRALADEHPGVRADAAFSLGLLGDTAASTLDALARTALDQDARYTAAAVEAVAALGKLGAPPNPRAPATAATQKAAAVIRTILEHHQPPDPADSLAGVATRPDVVANEALVTLWRLPDLVAWLDILRPFLGAPESATRWRAVYPLARQGAPAGALPDLLRRMSDPNPLVRTMAARALRVPAGDQDRDAAMAALVQALRDADQRVRTNAVASLATFRDPAGVDLAAALLGDPVGNVVVAAIQAIASIGGQAAADQLAPLVDATDRPLGVRHAALTGLLTVAPDRGLEHLLAWLDAPDWLQRFHAIRGLGRNARSATETLQGLVRDPDPRVAAAAVRVLAPLADSMGSGSHVFLEGLAAHDPALRGAAIAALSRSDQTAWFDILMEAYGRAQADSVPVAALAAVDALARLEDHNVPVRRAFFLRFARSRFSAVHRRVVQHFGDAEWGPAPEPAVRDIEFYRAAVRRFVVPAVRDGVTPRALIGTPHGEIEIDLAAGSAPLTVLNFVELAESGFWTNPDLPGSHGHRWHRVVPNFVLQDGEPRGDGSGRPDDSIRDEINRLRYDRGVLGMALSGPDTGAGQFFITHAPQPHLDGGYTIFGRVRSGMDAADMVVQDDAVLYIRIVR